MADVTVNIRGSAQVVEPQDNSNSFSQRMNADPRPGSGRSLVDEVRAELDSQRANSTREAIENVRASERRRMEMDISRDFLGERSRLSADYRYEQQGIDSAARRYREGREAAYGARAADPFYQDVIGAETDRFRDREYRKLDKQFAPQFADIDRREAEARNNIESELTTAIRELTQTVKEEGITGPSQADNSYIGQLRSEQRQLIRERDLSTTREGAVAAQTRLDAVNERIRDVTGGGRTSDGGRVFDPTQLLMGAFSTVAGSFEGGDIIGGVGGLATGVAALTSRSIGTALRRVGWIQAGVTAARALQNVGQFEDQAGNLARYRSTGQGVYDENGLSSITGGIGSFLREGTARSYSSRLGLTPFEFAGQAEQRIRGRGSANDWIQYTNQAVALERVLGLDNGALASSSSYDRYQRNGFNASEGLADLVTILSATPTSGVNFNDFSRVQEKYDIQQSILSSYSQLTDRPQFRTANRLLAGFSNIEGITQDARIGGDIASFQNALTNPQGDRARALLYNVVGDLFPDTGYQTHEIDKLLHDPDALNEILPALIQRVESTYGGLDTQSGYWSFRHLFPDITPDRLAKYVEGFGDPNSIATQILGRDGVFADSELNRHTARNAGIWEGQVGELLSDVSKNLNEIKGYWQALPSSVWDYLFGSNKAIPVRQVGGTGVGAQSASAKAGSKQ